MPPTYASLAVQTDQRATNTIISFLGPMDVSVCLLDHLVLDLDINYSLSLNYNTWRRDLFALYATAWDLCRAVH